MNSAYTQKAMHSVKWSALMEVVSRTASPIVTVVLARILTPADFGVMATAMIAVSFSQMFWDAGLGQALIQTKDSPEESAHVVFWTNLVLGLACYVVIFAITPWVSVFFNSPRSGPVLRVLGILTVIASLASVQRNLFVRELDFRRLFWVRLFTAVVPPFFSIPLALYGYGVWALVAGILVGQTLDLILLWLFSPWFPKLRYDFSLARRIFRFGAWVLAENLVVWVIVWGDNLIVGRFLGIHDLGLYRTGCMLLTASFGLVLNPFLPVLYPTFSRFQDDPAALKENFYKVNRIVMALALPMGTGMLLLGPELASVLFGGKWHGLGLVLSVFGLIYGLAWMVGINLELYRAMGRPDVNTKFLLVTVLYTIPAYFVAAQSGFKAFVYVRFSVEFFTILLHIFLCRKMLDRSLFYLWNDGKNFFLSSVAMGFGIASAKWAIAVSAPGLSPVGALAGLLVTGAGVYGLILWLLDRSFIVQTTHLIKRAAFG